MSTLNGWELSDCTITIPDALTLKINEDFAKNSVDFVMCKIQQNLWGE